MPFIHLTTFIAAPQERVFDLSRNVDLHKRSMASQNEQIIDGVMSGMMNLNETVTWKAKHFYKERMLTAKITKMQRPDYFVDEQLKGDFSMLKHEHYFKPVDNGTIMIDQFHFETPHGIFGKILNKFYLIKYMTGLLSMRNQKIKEAAESNQWKQFINQ